MKYAAITFRCRLTAQARFSAYKGSMLRGTLGTYLKKTCCTIQRGECTECMLSTICMYPQLFLGKEVSSKGHPGALTLPFCLVPGDTGKSLYEEGEEFSFTIRLFSYAGDYLPYFVHAFALAGQRGMGTGTKEQKPGTFVIEDVCSGTEYLYDKESQKIAFPKGEELELPAWRAGQEECMRLRLHLLTPCRFKEGNRLSAQLSFRQYFDLVLRRIRSLWGLNGTEVRFENFSDMLDSADAIRMAESNLYWHDWTRFSSRQKTYMQLGGLQGSVLYEGNLAPFLPFCELAEKIHIGKQTSFGLGQTKVEVVDRRLLCRES